MTEDEAEQLAEKVKAADTTGTFTSMKLRSANVSAVVHRNATGIDEDLGYVSYYHRNPLKHYWINFLIWYRGIKNHGDSFNYKR